MAEAAEGWEKHGCEEPADAGLLVAVCVTGVNRVERRCCNSETEHFGEAEGQDETAPCPGEGLDSRDCYGLVYGVIGCVARPACSEAEYRCPK